jgi:ArsR family transcriptional regulator
MQRFAELLKTAGDETRLRIIRLIKKYPLNVSELTEILGFAQSGISRHLGHLKKAGIIKEQREGMWNYYYPMNQNEGDEETRAFNAYLDSRITISDNEHADHLKLMEVIKKREAGTRGLNERLLEPGQSWQVWSRTLALLLPGLDVADFGCGDGVLSLEMARFAKSVVSIDNNSKAVAQTRKMIARAGVSNVTLLEESLENTSIDSDSVDIVFLSQTLHHLKDPVLGLEVAARVLKNGGRVLIMELFEHRENWVMEKLGHKHLGFKSSYLKKIIKQAGFEIAYSEVMGSGGKDLFKVILACGVRVK